jgi:hypothetical protein
MPIPGKGHENIRRQKQEKSFHRKATFGVVIHQGRSPLVAERRRVCRNLIVNWNR